MIHDWLRPYLRFSMAFVDGEYPFAYFDTFTACHTWLSVPETRTCSVLSVLSVQTMPPRYSCRHLDHGMFNTRSV